MTHHNRRKNRRRWAGVSGLAAATIMLLAGCVMPDGTVYTLPAEAPVAQTEQPAAPIADDAPSPAQPFFDAGDAALEVGDIETALEAFSQAIEADSSAPYGYFRRGLSYAYMGDLEAALADLDQAVVLAPDNVHNYNLRGEIRFNAGDMVGAIEDYERLVESVNSGAEIEIIDRLRAHYFSAQARTALGDLTGAADDLGQALRFNPFAIELYGEYRRMAGSAELMDEKFAEYARFAEESDSSGRADYAEGMKQWLLAQLTQSPDAYAVAVDSLTAAVDADADLAAAYHARGMARMGAAALQALMGTVSVGPDYATYTDPETGEQVTVSREEWDENWELQEQLAQAARAEAIEDLTRTVELEPGNAEFVHDLGVAHFAFPEAFAGAVYSTPDEAGREQALDLFSQAVELDPDWDQARLSRAIASLQWGMQDSISARATETAAAADIAYADDGSIVVLYEDTSFDRWDAETGELQESQDVPIVEGHRSLRLTPDGTKLVVFVYDGTVQIWDLATGELVVELDAYETTIGAYDAVVSQDGTRVAAAGREVAEVWDIDSGELLMQSPGSAPFALSSDGSLFVTNHFGAGPDLAVVDVSTGMTMTVLTGPVDGSDEWEDVLPYSPENVAFSPDGQQVAAIGRGGLIRVWDLGEEEEARVIGERGDTDPTQFLTYSSDGSLLAASNGDGPITVYDVETGERISVLGEAVQDGASEYAPTFSPDGTQVVSALPGGALNFRDPQTGELLDTWQRERTAEEDVIEQNARELLQQAIDDANLLVEREAGAGWPYFVRAIAVTFRADLEGVELDEEAEAQSDADWEAFTRLSPDVRQDDVIGEMPGQVRFSSPVAPADPLMAGRIEHTDDGRTLIHEAEGFQLQIPAQGPTGRVVDIYVPGGPAYVRILDDFRDFTLIVMDGDLGDLSAEEWLAEMAMEPGSVETVGAVQTELGEAFIVSQPDYDLTSSILPVDGRIFYFAYVPGWLGSEGGFAGGYGLKLEPAEEVVTEFVEGLSLLEE